MSEHSHEAHETQNKCCSTCKQIKPASEFYRKRARKDGLASQCKECEKAYVLSVKERRVVQWKQYRAAHRASHNAYMKAYRIAHHDKILAAEKARYAANAAKELARCKAYRAANPQKVAARRKAYYESNRERAAAYMKAYHAATPEKRRARSHRRRARLRGAAGYAHTTAQHIAWRWEMFGGKCWKCGKPAEETDHVIPLCVGGSHWPANLRPICGICNRLRPKAFRWKEVLCKR